MSDGFRRLIQFTPAYDKRHDDPTQNYGIGAMSLRFVLVGPQGATQFVMSTGWHLPQVQRGLVESERRWMDEYGTPLHFKPDGWDVGYHSPVPQYEGQAQRATCDLLPDGCYYDGSSLRAEPVLERFLAEGEEAVWSVLREEYERRFAPAPSDGSAGR